MLMLFAADTLSMLLLIAAFDFRLLDTSFSSFHFRRFSVAFMPCQRRFDAQRYGAVSLSMVAYAYML